ncbi:unnamed protein product [Camellia sinensis]
MKRERGETELSKRKERGGGRRVDEPSQPASPLTGDHRPSAIIVRRSEEILQYPPPEKMSKPLQIWDKEVVNGHIKRPQDEDIQSNVLEIVGSNVQSTYITCPVDPAATLGIKLPFLVMIVKNLKKYFTFEIQVLDDKNVRRRFRASNFQAVTRVKPFICTMPLKMDEGWNQIQLNLADFTRRAYGTNYVETLRVQVHANCRLRRIYFSDRLYSEEELPPEFKLYLPMQESMLETDRLKTQLGNKFEMKDLGKARKI